MASTREGVTQRIIFLASALSFGQNGGMKNTTLIFVVSLMFSSFAFAQQVGREAAGKFFKRETASMSSDDHYLSIHFGKFMESSAWEWGQKERQDNVGNYQLGITYKVDKFTDTMDWNIRIEGTEYDVAGEKPFKLSFVPIILFPEATSKFPLYFGAGAGLGVFFRQVKEESYLAFDYQLLMGARFFDVYENAGFFIESGIKNHLLLLTSGQFNSVFLSLGAVFSF
jgi:hypothetical protein